MTGYSLYEAQRIYVEAPLTYNSTEYKGLPVDHLYEIFLVLNGIEHRYTKVGNPSTKGYVERLNRRVLDEFSRSAFLEKLYESQEALKADLGTCSINTTMNGRTTVIAIWAAVP